MQEEQTELNENSSITNSVKLGKKLLLSRLSFNCKTKSKSQRYDEDEQFVCLLRAKKFCCGEVYERNEEETIQRA